MTPEQQIILQTIGDLWLVCAFVVICWGGYDTYLDFYPEKRKVKSSHRDD